MSFKDTWDNSGKGGKIAIIIGACCIGLLILSLIGGMLSPDKNTTNSTKNNNSYTSDNVNDTLQITNEFTKDTVKTTNISTVYKLNSEDDIELEVMPVNNSKYIASFFKNSTNLKIDNIDDNIYSFVDSDMLYKGVEEVVTLGDKHYYICVSDEIDTGDKVSSSDYSELKVYLTKINELNKVTPVNPLNW